MKFLKALSEIRLYLFLSGAFLSGTAAYYSIVGLIAIFSGSQLPILIMGSSLEFAKVVTATWLYKTGNRISMFMRIYLTIAVVILMFITSMGIFGFLSKAHLENSTSKTVDVISQIAEIQSDITSDEKIVLDSDKQLNLLDITVNSDYNILRRQRLIRNQLVADRKEASSKLRENNKKLALVNAEMQKVEVEVGPLKYIAELIYGEKAKTHLDSTVRIVILMLIFVFDPLAVMLLILASRGIGKEVDVEVDGKLFIHKDTILDIEGKT